MAALLHTLGKHQIASLASTVVDFGTMTLLVEFGHLGPAIATLGGASLGAVFNFTVSRLWVFPVSTAVAGTDAPVVEGAGTPTATTKRAQLHGEALRYAFVSAGSAGWNSLGELLLTRFAGLQYQIARLLTAVAVSLLWNFPLQRKFVFPRGAGESTKPSARIV